MWIWLVVAILAAIGEMATTGLYLAMISLAAVITFFISLVVPITLVQVTVFAVLSLLGVAVFRPPIIQALGIHEAPELEGPVMQSHLVGRRAVVTQTVDAGGGQVRVGQGEFWSARAFDTHETMPVGSTVEIRLIDGVTALVSPLMPLSADTTSELVEKKGT